MIVAFNNTVACEPFSTNEVTADRSKYYASVDSNNAVEGLKVVYGNDQIPAGSTIYVLAAHKKSAWALEPNTVTVEGHRIIFVPISDIRLIDRPPSAPHNPRDNFNYCTVPTDLLRFK